MGIEKRWEGDFSDLFLMSIRAIVHHPLIHIAEGTLTDETDSDRDFFFFSDSVELPFVQTLPRVYEDPCPKRNKIIILELCV